MEEQMIDEPCGDDTLFYRHGIELYKRKKWVSAMQPTIKTMIAIPQGPMEDIDSVIKQVRVKFAGSRKDFWRKARDFKTQ